MLFSPLSWGLGHATRDIPIINDLIARGHTVGVAATGIALELLSLEFPDLEFYNVPDYPSPYTSDGFSITRVVALFPLMVNNIAREHRIISRIVRSERYDLVISDNRFGAYTKDVPCLFISHQIRFATPGGIESVERMMEVFNGRYHRHFERVIVPDNPPGPRSLSGKLGYARRPFTKRRAYSAGILTDIRKQDVPQDIDYLVSISGPKVTKDALKKIIVEQIGGISGKKVILLGDPASAFEERLDDDTLMKSHADRHEMADLMNRAEFVITRSGYTTVMELAELEKKDLLFIPTPGQTEQEYLSAYYEDMGWVHSVRQHDLDLVRDVARARTMKGFPPMSGSYNNIKKLYDWVIEGYLPHPKHYYDFGTRGSGAMPDDDDRPLYPLLPRR
ncbi:MAG: hypothetical protein JW765_01655 [Deltaproteobacteria bacterium]|nr:hypothetical protein [Candidatus Zymogenaceae bacterium]